MITVYSGSDKKEEQSPAKEDVAREPIAVEVNSTKKKNTPVVSGDRKPINVKALSFLDALEDEYRQKTVSEEKVKVGEVLGVIARVYERIRTTIEYKGEHVLRRNAIERILRRLTWEKDSLRPGINAKKIAESIARELIWARYVNNNNLPINVIDEIEKTILKYFWLLENLNKIPEKFTQQDVRNWIIGVTSSEIEDILDPSNRNIYIRLMQSWFFDNFNWVDSDISDHEKQIQVYLAIHRSLMKSDEAIMRYYLLISEFPEWLRASREDMQKLAGLFPQIMTEIENHINNKNKNYLFRIMQKHSPAFDILTEIAKDEKTKLRSLVKDKKRFNEKIRAVCEEKYAQIKDRVRTGIIRSIIYIFISKVVFAMLLEIPFEIYRYGDIHYTSLFINIGFPPFLMWLVGMSISIPGDKNTDIIVNKINSFVYGEEVNTKVNFSVSSKNKKSFLVSLFGIFYMVLFIIVFGGISYLLSQIGFTIFGLLVFFGFMSLVLLFAYRIRYNTNKIKVETIKESILSHLTNYLTLPFLNLGVHLSRGLSKINFMTILLDFLIEAPLKNIIELFEEWITYVKEKREEVVEVPEQ